MRFGRRPPPHAHRVVLADGAGRPAQAREYAEEALAIRRALGDPAGIGHALYALAYLAYDAGDFVRARELAAESVGAMEAAGQSLTAAEGRSQIGEGALLMGRIDESLTVLREVVPTLTAARDEGVVMGALRVAGMMAGTRGDAERCAMLFGAVDRWLRESGVTLFGEAEVANHAPFVERARAALGEETFARAFERGADLTREAAAELAIGALD